MPAMQQRRLAMPFDARSVMLFAAIAMGGAAAQAQTASTPSAQSQSGAAMGGQGLSAAPGGSGGATFGGTQTGSGGTSASASFDRADTDKDSKLSQKEAARLPAISQNFKKLDTNHDGVLSREEFEAGVKS
ncbi:EF-hand domain-containing protein [Paracidovorax anthurii]|uniref:EF hand domain-containing protein n=2 Tax=Paracidovorax anthurii TaxID=78229 RepID=A0A328YM05_9BURK|nr:EF-hand domain-containing protein [Paracidovorax anthurii]RAR71597.1 EF hand domain-containing protein [Paracidovorax anthurii]